jgi:hypothetical protein
LEAVKVADKVGAAQSALVEQESVQALDVLATEVQVLPLQALCEPEAVLEQ